MATKKAAKKATKKKPSLSQLQKKLNQDTKLRTEFLKNPGGVLQKQGLEITAEKAQALADFTRQVTAPAKQVSIGSIRERTIGPAGARARIEVEVSVTVRF